MKKFLIAAVTILGLGTLAMAGEVISAPSGKVSNPITADYGGVETATSSFTTNIGTLTTVGLKQFFVFSLDTRTASVDLFNIYGADFSTGSCAGFIDVFSSTGGFIDAGAAKMRIYNVNASTGADQFQAGTCGGPTEFVWPRRIRGNVFFRPSAATFNFMNLLYWKEPE